jgi:superfamily II DNA/RNA helicase
LRPALRWSSAAPCPVRPDAKAATLIRWLNDILRSNLRWSDTRAIIFTEYRDKQNWLHQLLADAGLTAGDRLLTLYGGLDTQERERVKAAFQAHPDQSAVRILLATDAASEGIDLQNHCSRMIHYEIPWNPNRLEQRNGRVDRHGQRADAVLIYHFVGRGFREQAEAAKAPGDLEGDLEFLMRAALKVDAIRQDLGKVDPVIAEQVEDAMLGRRRTLDTREAERQAEPARRMHAQPGAFVHCRSWLMQPFPQGLPFLQTLQHCLGVSAAASTGGLYSRLRSCSAHSSLRGEPRTV